MPLCSLSEPLILVKSTSLPVTILSRFLSRRVTSSTSAVCMVSSSPIFSGVMPRGTWMKSLSQSREMYMGEGYVVPGLIGNL